MKTIILQSLKLVYFKGIKQLEVNFNPEITDISGANETGKTTLMDAFIWVLFGKDSTGSAQFDIKTLNSDNTVIEKVDHEVTAVLLVDGRKLELKKIYRENWVKRRGELDTIMQGHETVCYFDEVPVQIGEYNRRINDILDESTFKLITNPSYFNSLKWNDRREVLIKMAENVTDDYIVSLNPSFADIIANLNGKTVADLKAKTAQQRLTIKKELDQIPTRIDEVKKGTPEPLDYNDIFMVAGMTESKIKEIDTQIQDKQKANDTQYQIQAGKRSEINSLKTKQTQVIFDAKSKAQKTAMDANEDYNEKNNKIQTLSNDWRRVDNELKSLRIDFLNVGQQFEQCNTKRNELRNQFNEVKEATVTVNSDHLICPLFKHECDSNFAIGQFRNSNETAIENYNLSKIAKLESIKNDGLAQKSKMDNLVKSSDIIQGEISKAETKLAELEKAIKDLREVVSGMSIQQPEAIVLENLKDWIELQDQITAIEKELTDYVPVNNSELVTKRNELQSELDTLKLQLATKDQIEKADKRIDELNKEARTLSQQIADLEKIEYDLLQFSKAKMNEIDKVINSKFKYVRFKLFDVQINGAEIECCEVLRKGIPFSSDNHAGQVNSGLDIINGLCEHYGVVAPIFFDNSESVNNFIPTKSQLILLRVIPQEYLCPECEHVQIHSGVCDHCGQEVQELKSQLIIN